jgi:hypothetical protein
VLGVRLALVVGEVELDAVGGFDDDERTVRRGWFQSEDVHEELCGRVLVVCLHDVVVQRDAHVPISPSPWRALHRLSLPGT